MRELPWATTLVSLNDKGRWLKITLDSEKANLFIFEKFLDEPPSTTYDARVNGAPTKPRTAALSFTCNNSYAINDIENHRGIIHQLATE